MGITPLHRYYGPGRHRLACRRLPGWAGYTTALLHQFLGGARTVSPVAQHILVTVLSLITPPECHAASVSLRRAILPSPDFRGLGLRIYFLSRPALRPSNLNPGRIDPQFDISRLSMIVVYLLCHQNPLTESNSCRERWIFWSCAVAFRPAPRTRDHQSDSTVTPTSCCRSTTDRSIQPYTGLNRKNGSAGSGSSPAKIDR